MVKTYVEKTHFFTKNFINLWIITLKMKSSILFEKDTIIGSREIYEINY